MIFKKDEIYTIKVSNGDELVTRVVDSTDSSVTVSKPAVVAHFPEGMQLVPALFTANNDKDVVISFAQITMAVETRGSVADNYCSATSDIQTPSKSIIMG